MAVTREFRALRPAKGKAKDIASVPYDVVDTNEARKLAQNNPFSFLHVVRPEIDLPDSVDIYDDSVYEKAAENFDRFIQNGNLIQEDSPSLYLYKLTMHGHEQTGVVCCCAVEDYDNDVIKKHEHTRKEKEDDRLRHMLAISAHAGPVLMTYRRDDRISGIVKRESKKPPLYDFTADDGVRHTVWRMGEAGELIELFTRVPALYIADGHHRAAGGSRVKQKMIERGLVFTGEEEWGYFLAVLFPAEELVILPYNRWIRDTSGLSEHDLFDTVKEKFEVEAVKDPQPKRKGTFNMYTGGRWYGLTLKPGVKRGAGAVQKLDLSVFQREILEPVLGIKDQRKDKRIDFVGGPDSTRKLERLVDAEGGVAFSFFPVSTEELLAVSDAGLVMPPKSTWFVPKLRSGLLIHRF
ncbi:MAG: DUF1015 domain-containing protein [Spirochaetes bacterium]|nr:DUF1015 domain-containing protein [Spirochaetota bacterium]